MAREQLDDRDPRTFPSRGRIARATATALLGIGVTAVAAWSAVTAHQLRHAQERLERQIAALREARPAIPPAAREPTAPAVAERDAPRTRPHGLNTANAPGWVASAIRELEARVDGLETKAAATVRDEIFRRFAERTGRSRAVVLGELAGLARFGDREALDGVVSALEDPDPWVRKEALKALRQLEPGDLSGYVEPLAQDPDPRVRREAAKALAEMPRDQAGPMLTDMLQDSDPRVVEKAIESLVEMGYRPALPAIMDFVGSDNADVATAAGRGMRKFGDGETMSLALDGLSSGLDDPDPMERLRTARRLRDAGNTAAIPFLRLALNDPNPAVREKAGMILNRMLQDQAAPGGP